MEYIISGLVFIILVLFFIIRNLLKQTEQLDDIIRNNKNQTIELVRLTLEKMKSIDDRGVFEKDDEVGVSFSDLQNLLRDLYENL